MKFALCLAAVALSLTAVAADPPAISDVYTAVIESDVTGDIPDIPKGKSQYTEYYDFTNKRRRLDFPATGMTKVYRYDVNDMGHTPFPAPRGYQFETSNPKMNCCWLWLTDSDDPTNSTNLRMTEIQIPKKATDVGPETINGVATEHWHSKGGIVIVASQSDYWVDNATNLVRRVDKARIKLQNAVTNLTFASYDTSPIDESVFDVPKADCQDCQPFEIGTCKQFGKDPECDMNSYDSTGDDAFMMMSMRS